MLRRPVLLLPLLGALACGDSVSSSNGRAFCNGELDTRETTVDDLFDGDGDGFLDGANPQCVEAYPDTPLDCNDSNADVHPGATEATCNNLDDDCDEGTLDVIDADGDAYSICAGDCADENALINPGLGELLCDALDNDCDLATLDAMDLDADAWTDCDDCVDTDALIHPGQGEAICDGIDNDCDLSTLDGADADLDGSTDCFDCDDADPARRPGLEDPCDDGIDQNCDGVDALCPAPTWEGTWTTNAISYTCGGGNVDIDFNTVSIQDESPNLTFIFVGSSHPGAMEGTITTGDQFTASSSYGGFCTRTFTLNGSFTGANSFAATLLATFAGCSGCTDQSYVITGTR